MKKYTEYIDICIYILNTCTFSQINMIHALMIGEVTDRQTWYQETMDTYGRASWEHRYENLTKKTKKNKKKTIQFRSRLKHSTSGTYFCVFFICYIVI